MRPPTLRPPTPAAPPPLQRKSESVVTSQKPLWTVWIPLLDPPVYPAYDKNSWWAWPPRACLSFQSRPNRNEEKVVKLLDPPFWIPPCIPPMRKTAEPRAHLSFQLRPSREILGSPFWIPHSCPTYENNSWGAWPPRAHLSFQSRSSRKPS